jgi:hypothetical protein
VIVPPAGRIIAGQRHIRPIFGECYGDPDFAAGLSATIDWYRGNDWWWKPQKDATEAKYRELGR